MLGIKDGAPRPRTLASFKKYAKRVRKEQEGLAGTAEAISHSRALDLTAQHFGWNNYSHAMKELV